MKIKINNYVFNPILGTIVFSDYKSIKLDDIILITDVATGTIIYNFAAPNLTGSVSGNILTLNYQTSALLNSTKLSIYYDDGKTPATDDVLMAIFELTSRLQALTSMRGVQNDMRVTQTNTARSISSGTITTINTVSNISSVGGYLVNQQVFQLQNQTAIQSNINNIKITIT